MMNSSKIFRFGAVFILGTIIGQQILCAQIVQTLSGVADSVDSENKKIRILFEHPVTGEAIIKEFDVLNGTGFKNVKRLEQIQPEDPVSIDYEELEAGRLKAVYIEVVSLRKVPFTQSEVRKKLSLFGSRN